MRAILATTLILLLLPGAAAAQEPAAVTTGPAEAVTHSGATLTGTVDPNGQAREYRFEFGTTATYGLQTAARTTGAGDAPEAVEADLAGLAPATTYHYRLVAGGVAGLDRTFRTAAAPTPPGIARLRASERTSTSGRVSALIDPNGSATTWYVEWGALDELRQPHGDRVAGGGLARGAGIRRARPGCRRTSGSTGASWPRTPPASAAAAARASRRRGRRAACR